MTPRNNCSRVYSTVRIIVSDMRRRSNRKLAMIAFGLIVVYFVVYACLLGNVTKTTGHCSFPDDPLGGDDDVYEDKETSRVYVDKTWLANRKRLFRDAAAAANTIDDKVTYTAKVLIAGYMRGGSTLFGELFNRHYDHLLWYEPLDSFYMARYGFDVYSNPLSLLYNRRQLQPQREEKFSRRNASAAEMNAMSNFLYALLTCKVGGVPVETFAHPFLYQSTFFRPVYECLRRFDAISQMIGCKRQSHVADWCAGGSDINRRHVDVAERRRCAEAIAWFRSARPNIFNDLTRAKLLAIFPEVDVRDEPEKSSPSTTGNSTSTSSFATTAAPTPPSKFFFDHFRCVDKLEEMVGPTCVRPAAKLCPRARLIAAEVVRTAVAGLDTVIASIPDIHVIHYVRDPRAIVVSRVVNTGMTFVPHDFSKVQAESAFLIDDPFVEESRVLCDRMMADIRARKRLEVRYPGSISVVRYEDLVSDPNRTVSALFEKVAAPDDDVSLEAINRWLASVMNAPVETDAFNIHRTNARATASRWTTKINYRQAKAMNRNCRRVLLELGYEL